MSHATNASRLAAVRFAGAALLLCLLAAAPLRAQASKTVTLMTRNMDAGTDLHFVLGATDQASLAQGMALTLAEIQASNFANRAALLADEIAAKTPDLIALQEVTTWRTGPLLTPPAKTALYDQLALLMAELGKRNQHYAVVAIQSEADAEVPAATAGIDLRLTDNDVILARVDSLHADFDVVNAESHRFKTILAAATPALGQVPVPCGWMAVDVVAGGSKFRFVNTHLQSTIPGVPEAEKVQVAQATELLASLVFSSMPVVLAGDFNSNAETGPEHTASVRNILAAGYADTWHLLHPADPGYTWPLFGEDENSGPAVANERIDLMFTGGALQTWLGMAPTVLSAERTGVLAPWASDHAGLVVKLRLK
jgi:endonuclease/exonuclease/phosphatase family metal-dependent hydrolase